MDFLTIEELQKRQLQIIEYAKSRIGQLNPGDVAYVFVPRQIGKTTQIVPALKIAFPDNGVFDGKMDWSSSTTKPSIVVTSLTKEFYDMFNTNEHDCAILIKHSF